MSTAVQVASSIISSTMDYYAGDPQLLNSNRYMERTRRLLCSPQSELLTIRTAIHTQLRNALTNQKVQLKLRNFFDSEAEADATFAQVERSAKARACFFTERQRRLLTRVLQSTEQAELKAAHGVLAEWERENAILLRHPMFMTYHPSQALLLESAATVALYRQYASLNEGKYASESSDGEVPEVLKKLNNGLVNINNSKFHQTDNIKAGLFFTQSSEPFHVDEHNKMYSQEVLHNKRVEYEQLRETTAKLSQALMQSESMKTVQEFTRTRNAIFAEYGIDKLMALLTRRDEELSTPYEGGVLSSLPLSLSPPPLLLQIQPSSPTSTTSMSSASNIFSAPSSPSAGVAQMDELLILSSRVAQYSLPKIIQSCYQNFMYNRMMHEADVLMKSGAFSETDQASSQTPQDEHNNIHSHINIENKKEENMKLLKDRNLFTYWLLACLTADCPQIGPNKLVGKNNTTVEDYYKFWFPQKSSYVPTINSAHRISFGNKVADKRELPHFLVLAPVKYTYRENNDPNTMQSGNFDLMVYDKTNEEVLLIILNSHDPSRPHSSFVDAQEAKYHFAAVVRSALTNDNAFHNLSCVGVTAEYFFDMEYGEEESYYCVMAPLKMSHKQPVEVHVPIYALRPFTMCPPRFVVLGSNYGTSTQVCSDKVHAVRFAHTQLNELALSLSNLVPDSFVQEHILSSLLSRDDGIALHDKEEKEKKLKIFEGNANTKNAEGKVHTPRVHSNSNKSVHEKTTAANTITTTTSSSSASSALPPVPPLMLSAINHETHPTVDVEVPQLPREEEDMLSPFIAHEVFDPLRDYLLERQTQWQPAEFITARRAQDSVQFLPSLHDGRVRTPLMVFDELLKIKQELQDKKASDEVQNKNIAHSISSNNSNNEVNHSRPVSPQSMSSTSRGNLPSYVELNKPANLDNVKLISPKARRPSASATVAWFETEFQKK